MMMRKRTSFISLIQLWGSLFLIGVGVSIVTFDVIGSYRDFKFRSNQMRADYIAHQKRTIKQEVNRVVDMIYYEKTQSEMLIKSKIKSRVDAAYSIALNIYQQNKTAKSEVEIQKMIIDALRPIRFERGSGYYFVTRLDGVEMLFADKPEMEGLNLLDVQDTHGQFVVKDMIQIVKQSGEGFYEYHWTKPDSAGNDFKKISFIKRFEPYDWYIGTGLYIDDIEGQIKANLLSAISSIRFGKEGYIFINRLNGDALVSNGKLFSGTKKLWEVFDKNPEKMKDIFDKEYHAALKPEGDYIYYLHFKLTNPNKESPKASFIYGIPDLQWLVGAGVYLDDVEMDIALIQNELNNQIKAKILYLFLIVIVIVALFTLYFSWLNRRLKNDLDLFVSFFNRATYSDEEIDRETIKFAELEQMAEYANKMLADRKQAEKEKFLLVTAIEQASESVIISDKPGAIQYINPAFEQLSGFNREEIIGQNFRILKSDKHDDAFYREMYDIISRGHTWAGRIINTMKDGKLCEFETRISPVKDSAGEIINFVSVNRDVTQEKALESKLRQAQKMEAIGVLAGGVAHDFNNILTSIIGNAHLALMEIDKDDPLREVIEDVLGSGKRAAALTRQLLAFSRKQIIQPKLMNLNELLTDIESMLGRLIGEDIELLTILRPELWQVNTDPGQMEQVIMNLAVNAKDAMPKGGKLTIETANVDLDTNYFRKHGVTEEMPGDYVMLAVSDTGTGMDKETRERIFEPFFTTKETGKGTGLGLSTVYGIIKQNNGFIWVYSEPGQGTTFKVYLPSTKEDKAPMAGKPTPVFELGGSETILIVEDDDSIRKLARTVLKQKGYKVMEAENGEDALRVSKAHDGSIDLLITDVVMPKMGGKELAERLQPLYPMMKVIYMSGYTDDAIARRGVLTSGLNFFEKPFAPEGLARKVREILDR